MQNTPSNPADVISLLRAGGSRERREAVRKLGEMAHESAIPALVFAMGDRNRGVKELAIDGLIHLGGTRVVEAILPFATDTNFALRSAALEVLENIGSSAPTLITALLDHRDPTARVNGALLVARLGMKEATHALIACLEDENANVRSAALNALGAIGALDQAVLIRKYLQDPEESVRFAAVHALGVLGDSDSAHDLVPILKESSEACVMAAVDILGKLESPAAVPFLVERLDESSDTLKYHILHNVVCIAESLRPLDIYAEFGLSRFEPLFIEMLEKAQRELRKSALAALRRVGSRSAVAPVMDHIFSERTLLDDEGRRLAEEVLVCIQETEPLLAFLSSLTAPLDDGLEKGVETLHRVLGRLKERDAVPGMVGFLAGASPSLRRTIVCSLSEIGGLLAQASLVQALDDPNGHVRREAASCLRNFKDRHTILALFQALDSEPYPDVREAILKSLVEMGGTLVKEKLREFLFYPDPQTKAAAIFGIGQLGDREACDHLIAALNHEQQEIRIQVVQSLGLLECERMVAPLIHCLNDEHEKVRLAAVDVLRHHDVPQVVQGLITALRDPSRRVAYKAAGALGQLGDAEAVEPLMALLEETDYVPLKISVVRALMEIDDLRSEAVLDAMRRDPNPDLQAAFCIS
ncbi:MAG: HEAT repeat domain-containing protein [bacterium]|nr:HEAT repeat domain-containing protein [bacterium]